MKKNIIYNLFFKQHITGVLLMLLIVSFVACVDNPESITTDTTEIMGDYLKNRPEQFSEFSRLLDTTQVLGLVNAYGKYTMFAPNNAAMKSFYAAKGKSSLTDFPLDTLKKIAYDHIIKGYTVKTENFIEGLMPFLTMSERFVATGSRTVNHVFEYTVNEKSVIVMMDIEVSNGVIQVIDHVLDPSNANISQAIQNNKRFSIFSAALAATGLADSLYAVKDNSYDPKNFASYIATPFTQGGGSGR
ncbi:MAG: fasciclin domain-containing protein [Paludibacter sp.]